MSAVSIIVVSYNTRELLAECLRSVMSESADYRCEVWVVDNASTDGSPEMVRKEFPSVRVIANTDNCGFAFANNQALREATGDFLFLLNSDAVLLEGSLKALLKVFDEHAEASIAGPCLRNPDRSVQPSWGSFPKPFDEFLFQSFLFKILPTRFPYGRQVHPLLRSRYKQFQWVDWVTGAALIMRRQVYEAIGGLPENTFMYGEDLDYCAQAQSRGFRVAYTPKANVRHYLGASSRRDYAGWITNYTKATLAYYWRYRSEGEQRQAARWIIWGSRLRIVLWQAMGTGLKRVKQVEAATRVNGYKNAAAMAEQFLIQPALVLGQD